MKKAILYSVLAVLGLISLSLVSAQMNAGNFGSCNMGTMMYGGYGSGIMLFSWLFSLLVLVALILLIIWLLKQIQKK